MPQGAWHHLKCKQHNSGILKHSSWKLVHNGNTACTGIRAHAHKRWLRVQKWKWDFKNVEILQPACPSLSVKPNFLGIYLQCLDKCSSNLEHVFAIFDRRAYICSSLFLHCSALYSKASLAWKQHSLLPSCNFHPTSSLHRRVEEKNDSCSHLLILLLSSGSSRASRKNCLSREHQWKTSCSPEANYIFLSVQWISSLTEAVACCSALLHVTLNWTRK